MVEKLIRSERLLTYVFSLNYGINLLCHSCSFWWPTASFTWQHMAFLNRVFIPSSAWLQSWCPILPLSHRLWNCSAYFPLWKWLEPSALTPCLFMKSVFTLLNPLLFKKERRGTSVTQPMTRGRNLQLPNCQVILLIPASETKEKVAFCHMAGIQTYMKYQLFFFFSCTHSRAWLIYSSSGSFRVMLLATNRFLCFKTAIDTTYFYTVNFSFLTIAT